MELNFLDRKDRIILTTIDIMNEFGIHSVSTKEIARREGITEAAIFKHYPKKNDLYIAVLNYFSKYDNDIYQTVKLKQLNPIDAIIYYVDLYSSYFQSYPALTAISHSLDELRYNTALDEKVKEIINCRNEFVHPKPKSVEVDLSGEEAVLLTKTTKSKKYPLYFSEIKFEHSIEALKATLDFLAWVCFDICKYDLEEGSAIIGFNSISSTADIDIIAAETNYKFDLRTFNRT